MKEFDKSEKLEPDMTPTEYIRIFGKYHTQKTKQTGIRFFLKVYLGREIDDMDSAMVEYLENRTAATVAADLISFYQHPDVVKFAPMTKRNYLSCIEGYLQDTCEFELSPKQKRLRDRAKTEKISAVSTDLYPTRAMMKEVLDAAPVRMRAQILMGLAGGLRFGEILKIRISDIYLDETPVRVELRAEDAKNGMRRHTFLTAEAADAVRAYLKERENGMVRLRKNHIRRCRDHVLDETRLFPYTYQNEFKHLIQVFDGCGFMTRDERTGRRILHTHTFRKWFLTQAKHGAAPEFVESWAGHEGYLSSSYFRPSIDEEREEYQKAELYLMVNIPEDYIQNKIETADKLKQTQVTVLTMQNTMAELSKQIEYLKKENEELKMKSIVSSYGEKAAVESDNVTKLLHNARSLDE